MRKRFIGIGERESRLLARSNTGALARDIKDEYVVGPYERRDNLQIVGGPIMGAASAILEGTDHIFADLTNQDIERPRGIAGRTRRDIKLLFKDVFTLHPIRAISDAFRLAFADVPLDAGDAIFGFHHDGVRSRLHQTLQKRGAEYSVPA